jgi:ribonuclease VapC
LSFVVDTSALAAILFREDDADRFRRYLDDYLYPVISTGTLHELYCVSRREKLTDGERQIETLLSLIEPELVPFDVNQLRAAKDAYARYGRGSKHRANLNMGDCFAYALAKTRGLPLLFKGDDFVHTDVEPALKPA